jgi:hypothetical protein
MEYMRTQEITKEDDEFKVTRAREAVHSRAFSRLTNPPASSRWWFRCKTFQTDSATCLGLRS